MIDHADVTERATAAGWTLPLGFRVRAWTVPDDGIRDPRDTGDVYAADVEETDYSHPTRAFCTHCDTWIHQLDEAGAEQTTRAHPAHEGGEAVAVAGDWVSRQTGITCTQSAMHESNEPLVVRWWREDRWGFVVVIVAVTDGTEREWGYASLGGVEAGTFPHIDRETGAVESVELDPLEDTEYPLPDLIAEALHEACTALARHVADAPVITPPSERLALATGDRGE